MTYAGQSFAAIAATRSLHRLLLVVVHQLATFAAKHCKHSHSHSHYVSTKFTRSLDDLDSVGAGVV